MSTHRNVRLLYWHNFFVDFRPHLPVMVLYFAEQTGSFTLGMTVLAITMVAAAIFEVPTGIVSDMVGRRKTLIVGSIAGLTSIVLYATGGSFWILAASSVLVGLSLSFFSGNNDALLHDSLKEEGREADYARYLGRTGSMFQVGLGTSAMLGGIVGAYSIDLVMWIAVIPQAICVALSFWFVEPRIHDDAVETNVFGHLAQALREFRKNARLRTLSLASMIDYGIGETTFLFYPAFFALLWPLWAIGLARSLGHALAAASFWFAGPVIRRLGPLPALMTAKSVSHSLSIVAVAAPTPLSPLISSLLSVFYGAKRVAENTLLQREFTDKQRATMGSLNAFGGAIIFAIVSFGFGIAADSMDPAKALLIGEICLLPVLLLYWSVFSPKH